MAKKESCRVKTLSSFMKWAEQFEPGLYLFRGVLNEKYPIQASAYRRLLDERDQTPANLLEINKRIIDDARLEGHGPERMDSHSSDLELLAELQHYGAATCLIDFTLQCASCSLDGLSARIQRTLLIVKSLTVKSLLSTSAILIASKRLRRNLLQKRY